MDWLGAILFLKERGTVTEWQESTCPGGMPLLLWTQEVINSHCDDAEGSLRGATGACPSRGRHWPCWWHSSHRFSRESVPSGLSSCGFLAPTWLTDSSSPTHSGRSIQRCPVRDPSGLPSLLPGTPPLPIPALHANARETRAHITSIIGQLLQENYEHFCPLRLQRPAHSTAAPQNSQQQRGLRWCPPIRVGMGKHTALESAPKICFKIKAFSPFFMHLESNMIFEEEIGTSAIVTEWLQTSLVVKKIFCQLDI